MGIIICQHCGKIIEHFPAEKITVLYGIGHECEEKHDSDE